ncbi:hypothetical protein [Actinoplanes solisilvae]|uniref:hypothetical protein n=1 Tax=Actinoplanes solisilvae TaxID=2486853 RepID=UPI000FD8A37B|nr:hypothetical protein [Actinoplanes solisilvae]
MYRTSRLALAAAAFGAVILGLAAPASAGATGNVTGSVYGSQFQTHFKASGSGLYLNYVRVTADKIGSTETEVDFPSFVGCNAHVQLYRSGGGFNRDTAAVPCGAFVAAGASEVISIYDNVPAGKYCVRIWVDNRGEGYANAGTACFRVKGQPRVS